MTAHGAFAWSRRLRGMDWFGCKESGHMGRKLTDTQARRLQEILSNTKQGRKHDMQRALAIRVLTREIKQGGN